jgi:hypothetical protein
MCKGCFWLVNGSCDYPGTCYKDTCPVCTFDSDLCVCDLIK